MHRIRPPRRARTSIAALGSTARTLPAGPAFLAAIIESTTAPQPRSSTVGPGGISAKMETLETSDSASTDTAGGESRIIFEYPRPNANSRPTGNGSLSLGRSAAAEIAPLTCSCRRLFCLVTIGL